MSNNRIWKPVKGKEDWAEISSDGLIHFFVTVNAKPIKVLYGDTVIPENDDLGY